MKTTTLLAPLAVLLLLAQPSVQAQSTGSLSFGKPKAADSADLVTVDAKGQGESVEAAKKDAVRNAIKMAVGELVDAKTLVENDELVEDKILTLSNAMVEKADYGDAKSVGDGLFEVPVTAVVKKGQLNRELKAIGIAMGAVAGDSLAASLFSGKERIANAEKFFAERFKDFPQNVMEAVMLTKDDGSPDVEVDPDSGHVFANVGVRVNMENYAEWTKQFQELLGAVCAEKEDASLVFKGDGWRRAENVSYSTLPSLRKNDFSVTMANARIPVMIATPKKITRISWPISIYYVDGNIWKALSENLLKTFPKNGLIEVSLKDADGDSLCTGQEKMVQENYISYFVGGHDIGSSDINGGDDAYPPIPVNASLWWHNGGVQEYYLFIAPVPGVSVNLGYEKIGCRKNGNGVKSYRLDLGEVSEDDLAEVKGFEVKVEYR